MGYCVISVKNRKRNHLGVCTWYELGSDFSDFHIQMFLTCVLVCYLWQHLLDTASLPWLLCTTLIAKRALGPWCPSVWTLRAALANMSSRACLPTSPRFLSARSDLSWLSHWWVNLAVDCVITAFVTLYEMVLVTSWLISKTDLWLKKIRRFSRLSISVIWALHGNAAKACSSMPEEGPFLFPNHFLVWWHFLFMI